MHITKLAYSAPEAEVIEFRLDSMILSVSDSDGSTPGDDAGYNRYDNL